MNCWRANHLRELSHQNLGPSLQNWLRQSPPSLSPIVVVQWHLMLLLLPASKSAKMYRKHENTNKSIFNIFKWDGSKCMNMFLPNSDVPQERNPGRSADHYESVNFHHKEIAKWDTHRSGTIQPKGSIHETLQLAWVIPHILPLARCTQACANHIQHPISGRNLSYGIDYLLIKFDCCLARVKAYCCRSSCKL